MVSSRRHNNGNSTHPGVKGAVRGISGYSLVQPDCPIKLNQNECPFDVPEDLKQEIMDEALACNWGRYPDFSPFEIKQAIGEMHGVDPEQVLIGNGSNELVQAIFHAVVAEEDRVVLQVPTFTLYHLIGKIVGAKLQTIELNRDLTFDVDRLVEESAHPDVTLVMLCSPNNPTGSFIKPEDTAAIAAATKGIVVVDEAYYEFGALSCMDIIAKHSNVIITRTFSKALGAAGLRLGYMVTNPTLAYEIDKVKLPYNVNTISLIAARKLINQKRLIAERVELIRSERERVFESLKLLSGIYPYPSHANFILFEVDRPVSEIFRGLIEKGVLIRDVSHYPMLARAMRVTIGQIEENNAFLDALQAVLGD
tara:strand:+ start:298 stop:1395 length:1098 start_codon:yes stop_codon:yes gene_type:complete